MSQEVVRHSTIVDSSALLGPFAAVRQTGNYSQEGRYRLGGPRKPHRLAPPHTAISNGGRAAVRRANRRVARHPCSTSSRRSILTTTARQFFRFVRFVPVFLACFVSANHLLVAVLQVANMPSESPRASPAKHATSRTQYHFFSSKPHARRRTTSSKVRLAKVCVTLRNRKRKKTCPSLDPSAARLSTPTYAEETAGGRAGLPTPRHHTLGKRWVPG